MDGDAGGLEPGAERVDVVHLVGEVTEEAACGVGLGLIPVVGELDLGLIARGAARQEDEGEAPLLVDRAPDLLQAQLVHEEIEGRVQVADPQHCMEKPHGTAMLARLRGGRSGQQAGASGGAGPGEGLPPEPQAEEGRGGEGAEQGKTPPGGGEGAEGRPGGDPLRQQHRPGDPGRPGARGDPPEDEEEQQEGGEDGGREGEEQGGGAARAGVARRGVLAGPLRRAGSPGRAQNWAFSVEPTRARVEALPPVMTSETWSK